MTIKMFQAVHFTIALYILNAFDDVSTYSYSYYSDVSLTLH